MIVRAVTESVVYAVGYPLPSPPGYPVEPFIVVSIELINEEDNDTGVQRDVYQILSRPDEDAAKEDLGELPADATPEQQHIYESSVQYKQGAIEAIEEGQRGLSFVPAHLVRRVDHLVDVQTFERVKEELKREDDSNGKPGAPEANNQEVGGEAVEPSQAEADPEAEAGETPTG